MTFEIVRSEDVVPREQPWQRASKYNAAADQVLAGHVVKADPKFISGLYQHLRMSRNILGSVHRLATQDGMAVMFIGSPDNRNWGEPK
jgi:hypothetical protein